LKAETEKSSSTAYQAIDRQASLAALTLKKVGTSDARTKRIEEMKGRHEMKRANTKSNLKHKVTTN
jgi:hypothetical protein